MLDFFINNFSPAFAVIFTAAIPLFESKVAIPLGLSTQIWGVKALSKLSCFLLALFGSMLPAIFVILLARFIKSKTSGFVYEKLVCKIEERYKSNLEKLSQKNSVLKKCVLLATFVAIPLPLTGVYSGSLIAGFTNLKIWQGFLSIFAGEIISCLIVLFLSSVSSNLSLYILMFSLILIVVFIAFNLILGLVNKVKNNKKEKR